MNQKLGCVPLFRWKELGPHLRALILFKILVLYKSFSNLLTYLHVVAWAEAYLHTKWHFDPYNRLATIHQHHRQDRQWSDRIGRIVLQMVAQKVLV